MAGVETGLIGAAGIIPSGMPWACAACAPAADSAAAVAAGTSALRVRAAIVFGLKDAKIVLRFMPKTPRSVGWVARSARPDANFGDRWSPQGLSPRLEQHEPCQRRKIGGSGQR